MPEGYCTPPSDASITTHRLKLYSIASAVVSIAVLLKLLIKLDLAEPGPIGGDFISYWSASRLVLAGMADQVYNVPILRLAQMNVEGFFPSLAPFFYPPTFLLVCAPLALLSFHGALVAFMGVTALVYAKAASTVLRWGWLPALAYPAIVFNFIAGQNGMLTAGIIGAGLTLMDRRPRLAGAILGAMVIKPHLAIAIPIALILSHRWRVLIYAGLSALVIAIASVPILGLDVWLQFFGMGAQTAKHILEDGQLPAFKLHSVFGFARLEGASLTLSYILQAISAIIALMVMVYLQRRGVSGAIERSVIVVTSLLIPPYILHYDMLVLLFPCLWLAEEWIAEKRIAIVGGIIAFLIFVSPIAVFSLPPVLPYYLLIRIGLMSYLCVLACKLKADQTSLVKS
jgi:hypothetical protein